MTVCKQDYANATGWTFLKKSDGSWSNLDPFNFESDLDHHLGTKIIILIFLFTYYMPLWRYALSECSCLS